MKKFITLTIATMMLFGLLGAALADEPEEMQVPTVAEVEITAQEAEPAGAPETDPAEESDPVEVPETAAVTVTEDETEADEQTADPETAPEEPAEEKAEEDIASEPAEVEEEEEKGFSAKVKVVVPTRVRMGKTIRIKAQVSGANMDYALRWDKKVVTEDNQIVWETVSTKANLKLVVNEEVLATTYRLVLTAVDGTVKVYEVPQLKLSDDGVDEEDEAEDVEDEEDYDEEPEESLEDDEEPEVIEENPEEEIAADPEEIAEEDLSENNDDPEAVTEEATESEVEPEDESEAEPENEPENDAAEEALDEEPAEEIEDVEIEDVVIEDVEIEEVEIEDVEIEEEETPLAVVPLEAMTIAEATALREEADGMSVVLAELEENSEVYVIDREGDWLKVATSEAVGYIYLPAAEETEDSEAEAVRKVTIFTSRRAVMTEGEEVELTSMLEGFENNEIRYQWECDRGEGFEPVEGANDASYIYSASLETLAWGWRLTVYYR